uniref:NADH-ubiquinone oxidoreductase chain 2 n=1 Tax=Tephrocybe rancida TaxID=117070 RepID=A0A386TY63_9AGAR|nr:NADH dehydrogenase subunit 2 [Tephrocybe rancida]YP_009517276.1 NADH dehydrogenase subunit 2 [Tephrocybe rancida]AYE93165.1 NADH dehydrogenase subunit 2 [Tephrocybe rancida]AYE93166.1 NADH dehydrogenase subunit 2 [Tephrocybe rancida]
MVFISILTLIVAKALPSLNNQLSPVYFTRISALILLYAGVLSFNTLNIQSIGSGIGIYSGLFQVTIISQFIEVFLFIIGSLILIAWPLNSSSRTAPFSLLLPSIRTPSEGGLSPLLYAEGQGCFATKEESKKESFSSIRTPSEGGLLLRRGTTGAGANLFSSNKGLGEAPDYCLIVLFSTLGSCLLVSSSDLVSMYLSIELQSFGLYVLSTLYRDSESSTRAGLKYFLLGGLSSCLILLGSGLIYAFTGLTQFESIYSLISALRSFGEVNNIIQGLSLGLILIIIGFLFKIAAAPLHNWSPDVYDETPTIVTIWLTIMPKIAILILLLELQTQMGIIGSLSSFPSTASHSFGPLAGEADHNDFLKNLLLISSLLSLIIGTVVGLAQTRIKRLFAYSTISHIGFVLLALAINSEQSIESFLFYIIQYSITNLDVFLIILALSYIIHPNYLNLKENKGNIIKDIRYISELKGQFFSNPLLSLSLSICLFSMAGIPPLIGFFSKQFVLASAIQSGYYFIAFVAILVSVVSASYYLKIIKVLLLPSSSFGEGEGVLLPSVLLRKESPSAPTAPLASEGGRAAPSVSNFHSFLISTLTLSILFFIFKTSLILNSTQLLSLSLFYF